MTLRKRIFDLFFASILVVILGPVLLCLLAYLLIKEGRPLFHVAERMRGQSEPFSLWKLRTMTVVDFDRGVSGGDKFHGIAKADDGKLYCAPNSASVVLVIEGLPPPPSSLLPPPSASSTSALNDNALGIDRLGFVLYAKALVAVVKSAETPLSIGLYAQWGSGKTFFIGECLPAYRCIFTHH